MNEQIDQSIKKVHAVINKMNNHIVSNELSKRISNDELINKFNNALKYFHSAEHLKYQSSESLILLNNNLNNFIQYTVNLSSIAANYVDIVDIMNFLVSALPDYDYNENKQISKEEFSLRYDKLINLLKTQDEECNLILKTKVQNQPFKIFTNKNNSIIFVSGEEKTGMPVSKEKLLLVAFENKEPTYKSYEPMVIEKIFDNTIFDEIINPFIDELQNSTTEGRRIKELEDDKDKLYGQVKQLEEKLENHINLIDNIDKLYEKATFAEENFKNAEESILSKVETNASKSFWNEQATFFTTRYKFYLWTAIITTLILVVLLASYKYYLFSSIISIDSVKLSVKDIIAYGFIILLISLAIWIIRIFMKIALSSYHLSIDAKERVTMINTYISLMQEGNTITDDDKHIMIESIFRQTNHGIIKDENSVTVTDIISSFKK
jgi:hypothetical protein